VSLAYGNVGARLHTTKCKAESAVAELHDIAVQEATENLSRLDKMQELLDSRLENIASLRDELSESEDACERLLEDIEKYKALREENEQLKVALRVMRSLLP